MTIIKNNPKCTVGALKYGCTQDNEYVPSNNSQICSSIPSASQETLHLRIVFVFAGCLSAISCIFDSFVQSITILAYAKPLYKESRQQTALAHDYYYFYSIVIRLSRHGYFFIGLYKKSYFINQRANILYPVFFERQTVHFANFHCSIPFLHSVVVLSGSWRSTALLGTQGRRG